MQVPKWLCLFAWLILVLVWAIISRHWRGFPRPIGLGLVMEDKSSMKHSCYTLGLATSKINVYMHLWRIGYSYLFRMKAIRTMTVTVTAARRATTGMVTPIAMITWGARPAEESTIMAACMCYKDWMLRRQINNTRFVYNVFRKHTTITMITTI